MNEILLYTIILVLMAATTFLFVTQMKIKSKLNENQKNFMVQPAHTKNETGVKQEQEVSANAGTVGERYKEALSNNNMETVNDPNNAKIKATITEAAAEIQAGIERVNQVIGGKNMQIDPNNFKIKEPGQIQSLDIVVSKGHIGKTFNKSGSKTNEKQKNSFLNYNFKK